MNTLNHQHYDLIIAGGGMVGASLALRLQDSGKNILLVEAIEPQSTLQQSFDERTVALTYSSRLIFEKVGIWQAIEELGATAITNIHISDLGHAGMTHLNADMVGTQALGYVVPTRHIGNTLWQALRECQTIDIACPASIVNCRREDNQVSVTIQTDSDESIDISTNLIAIADGGRSGIAEQMGLSTQEKSYGSHAILCFIETNKPHNGRAYERFTDEGPIALLPYQNRKYACVWTSHNANTDTRMAMNDSQYLSALQDRFGYRAGRFIDCTARKSYPLTRTELTAMGSNHAMLIGNAAHKVHPVAGQGFNLGLRDAACAALLLEQHWQKSNHSIAELIREYRDARENEAKRVQWFTHGLISLFSHSQPLIQLSRTGLLKSVEMLPFIKRQLLKRTMGIHKSHRRYYVKH